MEIKEFGMKMAENVSSLLGDDYQIDYKEVTKNNGVKYHALVIREQTSAIAPTIYIDSYFREYLDGADEKLITGKIVALYRQCKPKDDIDVDFFSDFSKVSTKCCFKVVNYARNKKELADVPYKKIEDLALIPYCSVSSKVIGEGSITIKMEHLKYWEISFDELWENVMENAAAVAPAKCDNLMDFVARRMNIDFPPEPGDLYILTNKPNLYGAAVIFYPGMMEKMAEEMGGDFVIIPSSIHETIIAPISEEAGWPEILVSMVKEVNATVVSDMDILSDSIYIYHAKEKKFATFEP